ncbi:MAG: PaaI family thioesterase [Deltaproteobacteria bacterium]|nr:PaaI family thioesterase [Deltaproteobacteria bacterium]
MRTLNPAYVEAVKPIVNRSPYFTLISMEIGSLGWGESLLEVAVQEKHLQPFGMVHGGVYSSLVDAAAFWAVYPQILDDAGMTTVEMKLNFLAPSSGGRLIARGRSLRVGKTLCLAEASVDDGKGLLLAHGLATMMILRDLKIHGQKDLPPKFI